MVHICPNCGTIDWPVKKTRGSIAITMILWLCFLIPGLIYTVWRSTSRYNACPGCGSTDTMPIDSPRANKLISDFGISPDTVEQARKKKRPGQAAEKVLLYLLLFLFGGSLLMGAISYIAGLFK